MRQYRIKELEGKFTIECAFILRTNKGTWWKKKMVDETLWSPVSFRGSPVDAFISLGKGRIFKPLDSFKSIESAQLHIDKHILKTKPLEQGKDTPIYHQVGKS